MANTLVIAVIFLIIYTFSLFKLATKTFPDQRVSLAESSMKDELQLFKSKTSDVADFSHDSAPTIENESIFSTEWWCHDHIFQLERRAIFSKVFPGVKVLCLN